jgi:AraC family transcriptional regulator
MHELKSSEFFDHRPSHPLPPLGAQVKTIDLQPGLAVSLVAFDTRHDLQATAVEDCARIHFSCLLRGETHVSYENSSFDLDQGSVLATFAPGKRFHLGFSADCCNIELRITPQLLSELAGEESEQLCLPAGRDFCLLRNRSNLRIRDAAVRLERLMDEERAHPLLVHSAALEFLAWHLKSLQPGEPSTDICRRERRQLLEARERLLSDLGAAPTIEQLARETGLNQLKLKRGFKNLFGISIYAMFQRERMARARQLLQLHSVTETASILGYSNISHFSTAFRKQYGVLPREARRGALE